MGFNSGFKGLIWRRPTFSQNSTVRGVKVIRFVNLRLWHHAHEARDFIPLTSWIHASYTSTHLLINSTDMVAWYRYKQDKMQATSGRIRLVYCWAELLLIWDVRLSWRRLNPVVFCEVAKRLTRHQLTSGAENPLTAIFRV